VRRRSNSTGIDRGQIEGGLVQGIGGLTGEQLAWDANGRLLSHSASTYQIPSFSDAPATLRVRLVGRGDGITATQAGVVQGSKAVGEPPLMLALAVREALKDAVAAFSAEGSPAARVVDLASPLTHEVLFAAVQARRGSRAGHPTER
jgi:xanthine dehydrogenase large subunit